MDTDKKKKPTKEKKGEPRERKANWKEVYATVDDIKAFLKSKVMLRFNLVRGRPEIHWLSEGPVIREDEQGLLTIFGGEGGVTDGYHLLTDRDVNDLWSEMSASKPVVKAHMENVINSTFTTPYHPFRHYLDSLPPWKEEQGDAILALSVTVQVKGGDKEQMLFYQCLKRWLVAMVAGWVDDEEVNHSILVLIGRQGIYKTTWFTHLLPPQLREYFYTKTNSSQMSKDDKLVLANYGLVCCEELDTMKPSEMNQLKSLVTTRFLDERAAYERYHEHRKHIASFCGTGNNIQFLSDATGTRRWLPFEVESIVSPRDFPFDYDGIYSQAYALYKQGFPYYFSEEESERLQEHNRHYETADTEAELVADYFRIPEGEETGEFIYTAAAQQVVCTPGMHISTVALGRAFSRLGFRSDFINRRRGFYVVRVTPEERRLRAARLAYQHRCTDSTDVF